MVLAGNALSESTRDLESQSKAKYLTKDSAAGSLGAVRLLDDFLVQLAGSVDVALMPGENDPANQILPQQPLHPCLFPLASGYPSLTTVTNPHAFEARGVRVLAFSGQNVDDVLRNTSLECPLDALETVVRCGHMAPTCPDTVGCFPFKDSDPFVLRETPHVVLAANQARFAQRTVTLEGEGGVEVRLVAVPRFSEAGGVVRLNLRTLEADENVFETGL